MELKLTAPARLDDNAGGSAVVETTSGGSGPTESSDAGMAAAGSVTALAALLPQQLSLVLKTINRL
eukprot:CAMPEP_0180601970 /NCGR_PEP_ID=MMETSP1037_2-20121125/24728_1 /TAXON_ID=632150 /ORGANISM="Azadinium spinosum, Strain 3D9" /LENGTH=65 /DNA_ID=CAMNT_0022620773 /DNA_START=1039 /DNA_END=1236 /DNA_ORIENTATION=+